jgi:polyphosphate glucokinase
MKVLTVDVGGAHVKFLATGQKEKREFGSGKQLTAAKMVREVLARTKDWDYEAVSVGYPGLADQKGPREEPENLGGGWVGFDFAAAFGKPVKVLNDAAMQALGSYEGGRRLFLGLGTSVGPTFISEKTVVPLEPGQLPFRPPPAGAWGLSRATSFRLHRVSHRPGRPRVRCPLPRLAAGEGACRA